MQTIILCGGFGTRMKEETEFKPKPLIMVGGYPLLWHIMKIYSFYGFNQYILALGYKGSMIKDYFLNTKTLNNDFYLDTKTRKITFHQLQKDNFKITFAETGLESLTGKRILKVKKYIKEKEFMLTYGDGVSDIDINKLVTFHRKHGKIGTISGFHPHSKYGLVQTVNEKKGLVRSFGQKPLTNDYVSGGFMIFNRKAFDYFDEGPMENAFAKLVSEKQLTVYKHHGFWKSMDTYSELQELNKLWEEEKPWAIWDKKKRT